MLRIYKPKPKEKTYTVIMVETRVIIIWMARWSKLEGCMGDHHTRIPKVVIRDIGILWED